MISTTHPEAPYQAFIFDLYGTLLDIQTDEQSPAFWEKLSMHFRYNGARWGAQELKQAYHHRVTLHLSQKSYTPWPDTPLEPVFADLFEEKGVTPQNNLLEHTTRFFRILSTQYIFLYPNTIPTLEALVQKGKDLYLLSNAQGGFTRPELDSLGLTPFFKEIFISSEKGRSKPDPGFLLGLLQQEEIDPSRAIMTGNDLTTDIQIAYSCGIHSAYLHTNHSRDSWLQDAPEIATHIIPDGDIQHLLSLV